MNKQTIIIDVDEVICDSGFLGAVNEFLGTSYLKDDFKSYYIDAIIPEDRKLDFFNSLKDKNLYENPIMIEGAVNAIKELSTQYEILLCSACVMFGAEQNSGMYFKYKYDFLLKTFPFLNPNTFILTNYKNALVADIQIDDRFENLQSKYVNKKLLMTAYHNRHISDDELEKSGIIRVDSWDQIKNILKNLKK